MGLRAASVRHSDATVMAPALTEANQSDNFKLAKSSHLQTAVNGHTRNGGCSPLVDEQRLMCKELVESMVTKSHTSDINNANNVIGDALDNLNTLAFVSEIVKVNGQVNPVAGTAASDMNNHQSMDDQPDTMGLQNMDQKEMSSPILKEKQQASATSNVNDVDEQLLMIATGSDLGTNVDDFMQVLKNIEAVGGGGSSQSGADNSGDPEIAFPISTVNLTSFCQNLLNDVDVLSYEEATEEQMVVDQDSIVDTKEAATQEKLEELKRTQTKLERRYEFLLRRLQKIQARGMGQHISGEVAGLFELTHRQLKRAKERPPPEIKQETVDESSIQTVQSLDLPSTSSSVWPPSNETNKHEKLKGLSTPSLKNLVHKLEKTKMMQSNALYRNKIVPKYFGAGSIETSSSVSNVCRNNCLVVPPIGAETKQELERVAGLLETEIGIIQHQVDSDATASSSGAESCDEMQTFNNPHQQYCTM